MRRDPPCPPADRRAASLSSQRVGRGSVRGHLIHMTFKQRGIQSDGCGPDAMEMCGDLRKIAMKIPLGPTYLLGPTKEMQGTAPSRSNVER